MKSLLRFIGWLVLTCLILAGVGLVFVSHVNKLSVEARDYAQQAVPAIFSNWDAPELYKRATEDFRSHTTLERLDAALRQERHLGRYVKCGPSLGEATLFFDFRKGRITSATISTKIECERGQAVVLLGLTKPSDQWKIWSFEIRPPNETGTLRNFEQVRRYPDLGVAGSKLNLEFLARQKRYRTEHPEYLNDTEWPLRVAEESVRATQSK